jgi:predicted NodU family carbamoyl transferase
VTAKHELTLGSFAFYHESAAYLVRDGEIVAVAREERLTRKNGDAGHPAHAVAYRLKASATKAISRVMMPVFTGVVSAC